MAISQQKEARGLDYALLLFRITSRVLYSAQYYRQHCTLHVFEQFGALYGSKMNKEPMNLGSHSIRVGHSPNFWVPSIAILIACSESDIKQ